ncbi:Oidioi.mRNA.OKI2018_I69.XSR.g13964.t1.cds [Oikopleura dioica]|uniref:Oidioi.mRNA.OKI2018_I69.XSR.g13964.t1.cds n=1 Tax=Oikopleura dioica TaxID=34765 RepID=A0ABN7SA72_OIKDI|nr:Oidioi.mRNA.OKI2018_I69.XSR.g13964.t1.cds [Oikopleura dioica]
MKSTRSTVNLSLESTLVGADHIAEGAEELRSKSLFVVMDIIDVLEIQSCVLEGTTLCLGYLFECILYFYCYILLLILPTLSLAEISRSSGERGYPERWRMLMYLAVSLFSVNIVLPIIRIYLIVKFQSLKPSRIFLGKNFIYFAYELLKLIRWFWNRDHEEGVEALHDLNVTNNQQLQSSNSVIPSPLPAPSIEPPKTPSNCSKKTITVTSIDGPLKRSRPTSVATSPAAECMDFPTPPNLGILGDAMAGGEFEFHLSATSASGAHSRSGANTVCDFLAENENNEKRV